MAHLVVFQNSKINHPEDGNDANRDWSTSYADRTDRLIYEAIFSLQNPQ